VAARSSLDLEQDPRIIVVTRVFDAPRDRVWTAWTDPNHLVLCRLKKRNTRERKLRCQ